MFVKFAVFAKFANIMNSSNWVNLFACFISSCFPDFQIFVQIDCKILQSPEWSCHVGVPTRETKVYPLVWNNIKKSQFNKFYLQGTGKSTIYKYMVDVLPIV